MTISAGALIGSSLIAGGSALANKLIEKRRYDRQLADQHKLWQENNQYNSPQAQMARLKAAGLNPNLIYQNGGSVTPSDQLTPPNWQNNPISEFNNLGEMAIQGFTAEQDAYLKQATSQKTSAETANILSENSVRDTPLGKLGEYNLMTDEMKQQFANLYGVPIYAMDQLSIRGMKILEELRSNSRTRKNAEQAMEILKWNTNSAESEAGRALLALMMDTFISTTEARKHGFYGFGNKPDLSWQYDENADMVLEMYIRELKEKHWQSSDFKHFLDSFNQTLGNLPNVFSLFKKTKWSEKYSKSNFKVNYGKD